MTIIVSRQGITGDLQGDIARLECLLADLRHLSNGYLPADRNIGVAPLIEPWGHGSRPEPCLIGRMHGHPICRSGLSATSGLWVFAPELGWARTLNRFYRLGNVAEPGRPQ